jgi:hypothetical protein
LFEISDPNIASIFREKKEELMPWQTKDVLKTRQAQPPSPGPTGTGLHSKEVHVSKQKQTQKEVRIRQQISAFFRIR